MPGEAIYFIAGIVVMGVLMLPILRSRKKRIDSLETQIARVPAKASDFQAATLKFSAAVRESANAIALSNQDRLSVGNEQTGTMEKIELTMGENSRIAAEIVEKASSVSTIASKMETDVQNGFIVLEKNVKKMEAIKEKNSDIIHGIISLNNKVNKIRNIVRNINTITDQTKVIAFNAALEAAGAGETGKRFTVVSGEVNRLAEDIAVLTRQIRDQIEEIQNSSSALIVHSDEGSDRIAEGHKLIKDLEDIFKEILSGAEITSHQTQTITASSRTQLKSSEQICSRFAEITQKMKLFITAANKAAQTVETLTKQTHELEHFLTTKDAIGKNAHGD
jgi:methyl-accepting chemotaxis protein